MINDELKIKICHLSDGGTLSLQALDVSKEHAESDKTKDLLVQGGRNGIYNYLTVLQNSAIFHVTLSYVPEGNLSHVISVLKHSKLKFTEKSSTPT